MISHRFFLALPKTVIKTLKSVVGQPVSGGSPLRTRQLENGIISEGTEAFSPGAAVSHGIACL